MRRRLAVRRPRTKQERLGLRPRGSQCRVTGPQVPRPAAVIESGVGAAMEVPGMLVLSRQRDETIMIGDDIEITIVDIRGDKVRLGINAPTHIPVHRKEVYDAIKRENQAAAKLKPEDLLPGGDAGKDEAGPSPGAAPHR